MKSNELKRQILLSEFLDNLQIITSGFRSSTCDFVAVLTVPHDMQDLGICNQQCDEFIKYIEASDYLVLNKPQNVEYLSNGLITIGFSFRFTHRFLTEFHEYFNEPIVVKNEFLGQFMAKTFKVKLLHL